jgi:predicted ester cyclase
MSDITTEPEVHGISDEDLEVIKKLYRAVAGEADLLDEVVTADWVDLPAPPDHPPGPDSFKPVIEAFKSIFADVEVVLHEVIGAPGRAAVRAEIRGTHVGEWMGVAPTGKRTSFAIHEFHHLKDGRITHSWHLEDLHGWIQRASE